MEAHQSVGLVRNNVDLCPTQGLEKGGRGGKVQQQESDPAWTEAGQVGGV